MASPDARRIARLRAGLILAISAALFAAAAAPAGAGTARGAPAARTTAAHVAPAANPAPPAGGPRLTAGALAEMGVLAAEKRGRTAAQRKMDSHLIYGLMQRRGDARLAAVPHLRALAGLDLDTGGGVLVDIQAASRAAAKGAVAAVHRLGGRIAGAQLRYAAVRARLPLAAVEALAADPAVRFVRPASRPNLAHVDSEGDATHLAAAARLRYGVDGSGVKICALSDGVDSLAALQASGDLPPAVDVLPGQSGQGDEGTALLEILHDLAPGAQLGFATAGAGTASFAQNIGALQAAGCNVLVDDLAYPDEAVFQDTAIAQAVIQASAAGALYFSAAGNEGNLDAGTSGTWEGDFKPNGNLNAVLGAGAGTVHDFGDGGQSDAVTAAARYAVLQWDDPAGGSCNDYDLYLLDAGLTTVLDASTNSQTCSQDPFEMVSSPIAAGERLVVAQMSGAGRLLDLQAFRGTLALATAGCIRGHAAAAPAIAVAAAPSSAAAGPGYPAGPYPGPYTATQQSEPYTCDGPRRVFFDGDGNLLPGAPPGDFSSTGGVVRAKPDLTAADGVSTDVASYARFYGTSAAAPHAAAIAGLLAAAVPGLTPAQMRAALTGAAIDIQAAGADRDTGAGIVMAEASLAAAGAQPRPTLALGAVAVGEVTPDGDPGIGVGEDFRLSVTLLNQGGAAAQAVAATLATTTPGVGLTNAASPYPDIAAGGAAANQRPFLFTPYNLACGQRIAFTLTVTWAGGAPPAVFSFAVATGAPGTPLAFSYTGPAVPIPDATFAADGSIAAGPPAVASLAVSGVPAGTAKLVFRLDGTACTTAAGATTVGVDHPFVNDLSFDLVSPRGTRVHLIDQIDLDGHNFCQVVLDDAAGGPSIQTAASAQAPFAGSWLPDDPLSALAGEDSNGVWQLIAVDHDPEDTGNIRAFSLLITPAVCRPAVQLAAHLTAAKAVTGGDLRPGGTVTYTITLANSGDGASFDDPGDELVDTLPPPLQLTAATASLGTVTIAGNTVRWNGGVPAGGTVTVTIQAAIATTAAAGSLVSNQATVAYDAARSGANTTVLPTAAPGAGGPTDFAVGGPIVEVPALGPAGLAGLAAALAAAAAARLGSRGRGKGRRRDRRQGPDRRHRRGRVYRRDQRQGGQGEGHPPAPGPVG